MSISGGEAKRLGVKSLRQCPFIVNYNFFSLYKKLLELTL